MSTTVSASAVTAIEVLQSRAGQAVPGSEWEQIAENAINYAIQRIGVEDEVPFIVYDCQRNARTAHYRSRNRGRKAIRTYAGRTYGPILHTDDGADIGGDDSVADDAIANTSPFCDRAVLLASRLGVRGPAFVRRLMAGDTLAEAAKTIGISRATAHRWRASMEELLTPHRHLAEVVE